MARQTTRQRPGQTIQEVSSVLGISKDAVRKRIKRGKLDATKDNNGNWLVYLDTEEVQDKHKAQDKALDNVLDKQDKQQDKALDKQDTQLDGYLLLIEQLKKNNEFLEEQLKVKDEQIKAKDQQLLNLQILEHGKQQLLLEEPKAREGIIRNIFRRKTKDT